MSDFLKRYKQLPKIEPEGVADRVCDKKEMQVFERYSQNSPNAVKKGAPHVLTPKK